MCVSCVLWPQSYTFLHVYSSTERAIIIDSYIFLIHSDAWLKTTAKNLPYDLLYGAVIVTEKAIERVCDVNE